ncbi:unnamed protein product [Lactuca virosa]|uniref:Uncharacterized protein n=1 Tax=Lactuca virosa TaxID=75947 RepID=A0AAU9LSV8_9ASTR|nr:unnamed protein product [Lactuca virosa]
MTTPTNKPSLCVCRPLQSTPTMLAKKPLHTYKVRSDAIDKQPSIIDVSPTTTTKATVLQIDFRELTGGGSPLLHKML